MPFDPFAPDPGFKDDYDGTIVAARFALNDNGDTWSMELTVLADDGDETTVRKSLRKGTPWTSHDGGETITSTGKSTQQFHKESAYYKFLGHALRTDAAAELRSRSADLYQGYGPMHAAIWVGLRFHFETVADLDARVQDAEGNWGAAKDEHGTVVGVPIIQVTKYLGNAATNGKVETLFDVVDLQKLTTMAGLAHSHHDFQQAVMGLSDVHGESMLKNSTVKAHLNDKSWYEELKANA
jgi:hypothetical protein